MAKSEAVRIAEIQRDRAMWADVRAVVTDPLWSSVLGFIVIHEARKANLVGPVADDILYAGVIAINSARAGLVKEAREGAVGMAQAAGQAVTGALESALKLLPVAAGAG